MIAFFDFEQFGQEELAARLAWMKRHGIRVVFAPDSEKHPCNPWIAATDGTRHIALEVRTPTQEESLATLAGVLKLEPWDGMIPSP